MSQEDVETLQRGFDAAKRLDGEGMLAMMDPEVEFRPRFQVMLGGKAAVYWATPASARRSVSCTGLWSTWIPTRR